MEQTIQWRKQFNLPQESFVFLFAGKFELKKRPDLLVDAFLAAKLPSTELVFIGDGPMRKALETRAESNSSIRLLPFHNQSEMPVALTAADTVVLPSEGPAETWGLIINEAMACGTTAVVSDHVGCCEDLIENGRTGWQFSAGNRIQLSHMLQTAHREVSERRAEFRSAVVKHIDSYSYRAATDGLLTLLAALGIHSPSSKR